LSFIVTILQICKLPFELPENLLSINGNKNVVVPEQPKITYNCDICKITYKSRTGLYKHNKNIILLLKNQQIVYVNIVKTVK
jgi:hypothetical protein